MVGSRISAKLIKGDLGDFECGSGTGRRAGGKSVSVRTMGAYGLATQGGASDLEWNILGAVGSMSRGRREDAREHLPASSVRSPSAVRSSAVAAPAVPSAPWQHRPVKIGRDIVGGTGTEAASFPPAWCSPASPSAARLWHRPGGGELRSEEQHGLQ
jgi:hypothetical protein